MLDIQYLQPSVKGRVIAGPYKEADTGTVLVVSERKKSRYRWWAGIFGVFFFFLHRLIPEPIQRISDWTTDILSFLAATMLGQSRLRQFIKYLGLSALALLLLQSFRRRSLVLTAFSSTKGNKLWECEIWRGCVKANTLSFNGQMQGPPVPIVKGRALLSTVTKCWQVCDVRGGPDQCLGPKAFVPATPDIVGFGDEKVFFNHAAKGASYILEWRTGALEKVARGKQFHGLENSFVLFKSLEGWEYLDLDTGEWHEVCLDSIFAAKSVDMKPSSFYQLYSGMSRVFPSDLTMFKAGHRHENIMDESAKSLVKLLEQAGLWHQAAWIAEEGGFLADAARLREHMGQYYHAAFLYSKAGSIKEGEGQKDNAASQCYWDASRCLRLEQEANTAEMFANRARSLCPTIGTVSYHEPQPPEPSKEWRCPVDGYTVAKKDLVDVHMCPHCFRPTPLPCPNGHFPMENKLFGGRYCNTPGCGEDLWELVVYRRYQRW